MRLVTDNKLHASKKLMEAMNREIEVDIEQLPDYMTYRRGKI